MAKASTPRWVYHLAQVADPRIDRRRLHNLGDILVLAVVGTLCGFDDFVGIAEFGQRQEAWFRKYLALPNGIPSHDTINRVFRKLCPVALGAAVQAFLAEVFETDAVRHFAIDGTTSRSTSDARHPSPLHMVSAYAVREHLVLGQMATDEKSNEITAIPKVLELLDLRGATVTIDAMGCQRDIAQQVVDAKGSYILAVKDNQPKLREEIDSAVADAQPGSDDGAWSQHVSKDEDHGRIVTRMAVAKDNLDDCPNAASWPGAVSIVVVESERTVNGQTTLERRRYITSKKASVKVLARLIRAHWAIENSLHWVLDVAFNDDRSRARRDNAAANLVVLRQLTAGLLRRGNLVKAGIKTRRLIACGDEGYREAVLAGCHAI